MQHEPDSKQTFCCGLVILSFFQKHFGVCNFELETWDGANQSFPSWDLLSCGEDFFGDFLGFGGFCKVGGGQLLETPCSREVSMCSGCDLQGALYLPCFSFSWRTIFPSSEVFNTNLLGLHQPLPNFARKTSTVFWWGIFLRISCRSPFGLAAQKIPPKHLRQNPHRNPHTTIHTKKSAPKSPQQKSLPKNPHQKILTKEPAPKNLTKISARPCDSGRFLTTSPNSRLSHDPR